MSRLASPRFPATCRGSGIPFDRQSSVLPGSVVSTVERLHRRPTVSDKSGKRRANTPSAPENSQNDHLEPKLKRGPRRVMQEPRLVWAFVGPPRVWRSGVPANRKRSRAGNRPTPPRRNFTRTFRAVRPIRVSPALTEPAVYGQRAINVQNSHWIALRIVRSSE
jgi:hypothetical protein